ncbi:MAG: TSUP family transporter [Lachnospiraceae bacterium]|nr:TSUP family transporter [Lachnospiraceae bacterium]
MELHLLTYVIVCPAIFLASFVDAIAGGGGLISLPAYLLAGLPIHAAIATNKLSSTTGTAFSTARLVKNRYADMKVALPSIAAALVGSVIGANAALHTSERVLQLVLLILLPLVAFYVLTKKNLEPKNPFSLKKSTEYTIVVISSFVIGMYDGFYGPGTGTFLLLAFTGLARMDLRTASGNMKIVNLSSNIAALVTFILAGKIVWRLGLAACVFSIAGHYLGAGFVMKDGSRIVRPIIIVVLVLLFIKIISGLI